MRQASDYLSKPGLSCKFDQFFESNESHLKKWATLDEMGHFCKKGSHLAKWVIMGDKMGHNWRNGKNLLK